MTRSGITFAPHRVPVLLLAILFASGACSSSAAQPQMRTTAPTGAATPAATTPGRSAGARAPICPDLNPAWVGAAHHPNDGVPDPAGRILFGQIHREDDVIGQVIAPLFAMDADGSDVVQVVSCELERPRVSHDGRRIAFSIAMDDGTWQVAKIAANGTDLRILTSTTGYAETPDWSPDGSWLIYASSPVQCSRDPLCDSLNETLWLMNADGSDQRLVGNPPSSAWDWEPRLSPDGTEVVFVRNRPEDGFRWHVMIRNLESGQERVVRAETRDVEHPEWSTDGRFIVYNVTPNGPIERISVDDPNAPVEALTTDASHSAFKPVYSPDGSSIVFGCDGGVCRMNADGSDVAVLLDVPDVNFNHFDWGPAMAPSP